MSETRDAILDRVRIEGEASASMLARSLELSLGAVRHHLIILERDGLLLKRQQRHGVGKPANLYRLSPQGEESFPKNYDKLLSAVLNQLESEGGVPKVEDLLRRLARKMVHERTGGAIPAFRDERVNLLVGLFEAEGFQPQVESSEKSLKLRQMTCPYHSVAMKHPEVCCLDKELIECTLDAQVELAEWRPNGDGACVFVEAQGQAST
ncbi:MAG: helix-turn-helix transcriptional regulator [Nitrospiraceae bacterium]